MSTKIFNDVSSAFEAIQSGVTLIAQNGSTSLRGATFFERLSIALNRKVLQRDPRWLEQNNTAVGEALNQLIAQSKKTWTQEDRVRIVRTLTFAGLDKVARILSESQTQEADPVDLQDLLARQKNILFDLISWEQSKPLEKDELRTRLTQYAKDHKVSDIVLVSLLRSLDEADTKARVDEMQGARIITQALEDFHFQALGYELSIVTDLSQVKLVKEAFRGEGGGGVVSDLTLEGKNKVIKQFHGDESFPIKLDPSNSDNITHPRLYRSPEIASAFLRDSEAGVVIFPSHYLVREKNGKKVRELLVAHGDKDFRAWAKNQLARNIGNSNYSLEIFGEVQDRALGQPLNEMIWLGRVDEQGLKKIAVGFLDALDSLGKRGFVHRDIKPQNAFFDPSTGQLKLIDVGGLAKVSKHLDQRPDTTFSIAGEGGVTLSYALAAHQDTPNGFAQDLYAAGVSIIETAISVQTRNMKEHQRKVLFSKLHIFLQKVDFYRNPAIGGWVNAESAKKDILALIKKTFPLTENSVEAVGVRSLEYALTANGQWDDLRDRETYHEIITKLRAAL